MLERELFAGAEVGPPPGRLQRFAFGGYPIDLYMMCNYDGIQHSNVHHRFVHVVATRVADFFNSNNGSKAAVICCRADLQDSGYIWRSYTQGLHRACPQLNAA